MIGVGNFTRYIIGNFLKLYLILTFGITFIFVSLDYVNQIKMWTGKEFEEIYMYYFYYLPHVVHLMMPFIALFTTIGTVAGMAKHFELIPMQNAGIPKFRLLWPIVLIGILITYGMYYFNTEFIPDATYKRLQIAQPKTKKNIKRDVYKRKLIYVGGADQTFYFKKYDSRTQTGDNVILYYFNNKRLHQRFDARKMIWKDSLWLLTNVHLRDYSEDSITVTSYDSLYFASIQEKPINFLDQRYTSSEMNEDQIQMKIANLKRIGERTEYWETHFYNKTASSFINIVVMLFGLAFSHKTTRKAGMTKAFALGISVAFAFYLVNRIGISLGENGAIHPGLGAWLANIIFGTIGLLVFFRSIRI